MTSSAFHRLASWSSLRLLVLQRDGRRDPDVPPAPRAGPHSGLESGRRDTRLETGSTGSFLRLFRWLGVSMSVRFVGLARDWWGCRGRWGP